MIHKQNKMFWALAISLCLAQSFPVHEGLARETSCIQAMDSLTIVSAEQINPTSIDLLLSNQKRISLDFYGDNIFRAFYDPNGGILRDPQAKPEAQILVDNPRRALKELAISEKDGNIVIQTSRMRVDFSKASTQFEITDLKTGKRVLKSLSAIQFEDKKFQIDLLEAEDEYFFGGGVQNGRFTHKGKAILIENTNSWTDGGVASPTPFYWSDKGYGVMFYTFKKGRYDFGAKEKGKVSLSHESDYFDAFFMVDQDAVSLLNDFYQLTGNPVLIPKFGFYQGHLNAYNRDYWKEDPNGILFEDGKRYKESQKDKTGVRESLNGELNNYQFSARAVIDRYKAHDMPLGWILPNDGYGAGYGQTSTIDGNIANLRSLGDYARERGVEIGLWTQSDLHPKDGIEALLQRDIVKEVRDAGVRVLKTDVAWVGAGYSFGLNGVADVGQIMPYYGNNARPFIISLDGWAGTQRYAGIWSGDQTGGMWEYIRFHIPTYIGSGLSGQPNISSDVDGIFGGKNTVVNTRDFQWKTFTPMQLNMDGWGSNEKYPHALGEPITSINRHYLKWKSALMPYAYSIAKEAVDGKPMIRAMFLEQSNPYTLSTATQYQFLYGPYILVAPIYQATAIDTAGNDIRNHIYLPEGTWLDYFTGETYAGNQVINNYKAPLWKLPVFIKRGAILPVANANNHIGEIDKQLRIVEFYPYGESSFKLYDDDGKTEAYRLGEGVETMIYSKADQSGNVLLSFAEAKGSFKGFDPLQATEFRVNVTERPKKLELKAGNRKIKLQEVKSKDELKNATNAYYYEERPNLNQFATKGSAFAAVEMLKNPVLIVKSEAIDITKEALTLSLKGYVYNPNNSYASHTGQINSPSNVQVKDANAKAYTLRPTWDAVNNADYYEIDFQDMHYSLIRDTTLLFEGLKAESDYEFKIRAANKDGFSDWRQFSAKTKANPLLYAIKGIVATTSVPNQGGEDIDKLFDYDEGNMWHTAWGYKAVPFEIVMDLKSFNQLDKFQYLPRSGRGNGVILTGKVSYSSDQAHWEPAGEFAWANTDEVKVFNFDKRPNARYIKIEVSKAVGDFGSGRELYVFKVPGTESYIPGDINNDRLINRNDYTSYVNYTGLRQGDADFEGYVSNGDGNKNGLIDAYDISVVATQIDGKAKPKKEEHLKGQVSISTAKTNYAAGETVEILVKGTDLNGVNALSFALPYAVQDFEYAGIENLALKQMDNLTNDRLHTNGQKALYPTFVNVGDKETVNGSKELFIIKLKAKRNLKFSLKAIDGIIVDKNLKSINF